MGALGNKEKGEIDTPTINRMTDAENTDRPTAKFQEFRGCEGNRKKKLSRSQIRFPTIPRLEKRITDNPLDRRTGGMGTSTDGRTTRRKNKLNLFSCGFAG